MSMPTDAWRCQVSAHSRDTSGWLESRSCRMSWQGPEGTCACVPTICTHMLPQAHTCSCSHGITSHIHTCTLAHTYTHAHGMSAHTHTLSYTHAHGCTLIHIVIHTCSLAQTQTHPHTCTHTYAFSHAHTLSHTRTQPHAHMWALIHIDTASPRQWAQRCCSDEDYRNRLFFPYTRSYNKENRKGLGARDRKRAWPARRKLAPAGWTRGLCGRDSGQTDRPGRWEMECL